MKIRCSRSIFIYFAAFAILFFALPGLGLADDSALQVMCVDASGAPVQGVKVIIASLKNLQKTKDKKSNDEGEAEFTKLDDGAYRVFGRKEGFVPALHEFALLKGSRQSVTLKFEAGADKKFYFEDDAELQKAQALLKQGFEAYQGKKFAEAEKLFKESLAINGSTAEGLYYLAMSLIQQSKYDEGMQILDRTVDVASAWLTVPVTGGQPGKNPYEQIVQSARQMKKNVPAIRAETALRNKDYDQAVKEFYELIKADPNQPDFHANLAIALANLQKYDESLAAVDQAMKLKPGSYGEIKTAITARKEAAKLEKAQAILDEGNKLLQDGNAETALEKFEEAKTMVEQDRQSPIWRQIGKAQAKLNRPEAVESFKKAIELSPADKVSEYRNSFAQYYLDAARYEEALDVLIDPQAAGSQEPEEILLGVAKSSKDRQPKLAEAALERVIKANPENIDACFDLAQLYYMDGKEMDGRTKELLARYMESGTDETKLQTAKDFLVIINRRSK